MIESIITLLSIADQEGFKGKYIDVALGKNKYPKSILEAWNQFKKEQWQK